MMKLLLLFLVVVPLTTAGKIKKLQKKVKELTNQLNQQNDELKLHEKKIAVLEVLIYHLVS